MSKIYFSIEEIVRHLDRPARKTSSGYKIRCLNPNHPDKNPSGIIYKNTGSFHCFSCGFHLTNYQLAEEVGLIKKENKEKRYLPTPMGVKEEEKKKIEKPKHYNKIEGEYLKLNITSEIRDVFEVGVCEAGIKDNVSDRCAGCFFEKNWIRDGRCGFAYGRIMIPVVSSGELFSIESRLITKAIRSKKVLYPEGSRTGDTIFNYDNLKREEPLYVTEGIKGALKIYRHISKNVTAIFSNQLKGIQGDLIKHFSHVILLPDLGTAGELTIKQFSELGVRTLEVVTLPEFSICRTCGKWTRGLSEKSACSCGSEDTVYADVFDFDVEDIKSAIYKRKVILDGSFSKREMEEIQKPPRDMRKKSNDSSGVSPQKVG